jgi:hypothetical protein
MWSARRKSWFGFDIETGGRQLGRRDYLIYSTRTKELDSGKGRGLVIGCEVVEVDVMRAAGWGFHVVLLTLAWVGR